MIFLLSLSALVCTVSADAFGFGIGKIPPYGIGKIPLIEAEKEEIEKGFEIPKEFEIGKDNEAGKELSFEKVFPWLEKEFAFDNGVAEGMEIEKDVELGSLFGLGFEKGIGMERAMWYPPPPPPYPWSMWEKYFEVEKKKLTFEQALAIELFKKYGYYGLWVARELERRFAIAIKLGLIGKEIAFQEAISIGLFKGIGLDKIFEASLKAAGIEKAKAAEATRESLDKVFASLWKKSGKL